MWAVIPIKNLNETKHRLKSALNPQERRDFFVEMFEDVLTTLLAVPELEQVAVATVCPIAGKIAKKYGTSVLFTEKDEGQTAAVTRTAEILESKRVAKMLMLPGDVPLVTVEEIQTVIATHENACSTPDVPAYLPNLYLCLLFTWKPQFFSKAKHAKARPFEKRFWCTR